jgi:hypothetical protein
VLQRPEDVHGVLGQIIIEPLDLTDAHTSTTATRRREVTITHPKGDKELLAGHITDLHPPLHRAAAVSASFLLA